MFNASKLISGVSWLSRIGAMIQGSNASNAVETLATSTPPEVGHQTEMSFTMSMTLVTTRLLVVAEVTSDAVWSLSSPIDGSDKGPLPSARRVGSSPYVVKPKNEPLYA